MKSFFFIVLFIFLVSGCSECNLFGSDDCPGYLDYRLPVSYAPLKDTFQLGDTLYIEMNFPDTLFDIHGVENIFSNYDFRLELAVDRIDIDPPASLITEWFPIEVLIGSHENEVFPQSGVSCYKIIPLYDNNRYHFKCKLILNERGLFGMGLNPFETRFYPFDINGNCDHVPLYIGAKLINSEMDNFEMLQFAANSAYWNTKKDIFESSAGYCFYVE